MNLKINKPQKLEAKKTGFITVCQASSRLAGTCRKGRPGLGRWPSLQRTSWALASERCWSPSPRGTWLAPAPTPFLQTPHLCSTGARSPWRSFDPRPSECGRNRWSCSQWATSLARGTPHGDCPQEKALWGRGQTRPSEAPSRPFFSSLAGASLQPASAGEGGRIPSVVHPGGGERASRQRWHWWCRRFLSLSSSLLQFLLPWVLNCRPYQWASGSPQAAKSGRGNAHATQGVLVPFISWEHEHLESISCLPWAWVQPVYDCFAGDVHSWFF